MLKNHIRNSLFILLLIGSLFPLLSYKSPDPDWIRVNVDSTVSVQFPGQPASQVVNGIQLFAVRTQEALFMTMIMDQTPQPGQKPIADVYSFYLGFMDSMIENANATLTDSSTVYVHGFQGIDFSYKSVLSDGSKITRHNRAVLIKNKMYSLGYTPSAPPSPTTKAEEKQFIESLQVLK